jgi:GT2 family glycosyltransferase
MSFCFAYITDGKNDDFLKLGIQSIREAGIDDYEILIIGDTKISDDEVRVIGFDESIRPGWITRKKNLVAKVSNKEILVIMHDYFALTPEWSNNYGALLSNSTWDVAVTSIVNPNGSRYRDWLLWPFSHRLLRIPFIYTLGNLLPYHISDLTDFMYVNGSLMIVKRGYLAQNPLDEKRSWGEGEDVEWSIRLRKSWRLVFFQGLTIRSLKHKDTAFRLIDPLSLMAIRIYSFAYRSFDGRLSKHLEIPY